MKQKINFENIRNVIEKGGNNKLKGSLRKIVDNENVDLDEIEEEVPKYVDELPDLIDRKILEIDKRRREEEEQRRIEEERMRENEKVMLPPINPGLVDPNDPNNMIRMTSEMGYISDMNNPIEGQRQPTIKLESMNEEDKKKKKGKKKKEKRGRSKSKKKKKGEV